MSKRPPLLSALVRDPRFARLPDKTRLIAYEVAGHLANADGAFTARLPTIGAKLGVAPRTVQRHFAQLEAAGVLTSKRTRGPSTYTFLPEAWHAGSRDNQAVASSESDEATRGGASTPGDVGPKMRHEPCHPRYDIQGVASIQGSSPGITESSGWRASEAGEVDVAAARRTGPDASSESPEAAADDERLAALLSKAEAVLDDHRQGKPVTFARAKRTARSLEQQLTNVLARELSERGLPRRFELTYRRADASRGARAFPTREAAEQALPRYAEQYDDVRIRERVLSP